MAGLFDFLGPAQTALNLAGAGSAVASLFGMGRDRRTEKAMRAQAERAAQLSEALTNPSSPLFQSMASDALQQQRTARLQGISDYVREQERQARRFAGAGGNASFYARNPRRDEAIARALMMAGQNEQAQANQQARQTLMSGLQGIQGAMGATSSAANVAAQNALMRQVGLPSTLFGASRFLKEIPTGGFESPVGRYDKTVSKSPMTPERFSGLLGGGV